MGEYKKEFLSVFVSDFAIALYLVGVVVTLPLFFNYLSFNKAKRTLWASRILGTCLLVCSWVLILALVHTDYGFKVAIESLKESLTYRRRGLRYIHFFYLAAYSFVLFSFYFVIEKLCGLGNKEAGTWLKDWREVPEFNESDYDHVFHGRYHGQFNIMTVIAGITALFSLHMLFNSIGYRLDFSLMAIGFFLFGVSALLFFKYLGEEPETPVVAFNEKGIYDNFNTTALGFVKWEDIELVSNKSWYHNSHVYIYLKPALNVAPEKIRIGRGISGFEKEEEIYKQAQILFTKSKLKS